jgi:hypothetical protein
MKRQETMDKPVRKSFQIRNHDANGYWLTDDRRYFEYAHLQLSELEQVTEKVKQLWPTHLDKTILANEHSPELEILVRKREGLSMILCKWIFRFFIKQAFCLQT